MTVEISGVGGGRGGSGGDGSGAGGKAFPVEAAVPYLLSPSVNSFDSPKLSANPDDDDCCFFKKCCRPEAVVEACVTGDDSGLEESLYLTIMKKKKRSELEREEGKCDTARKQAHKQTK